MTLCSEGQLALTVGDKRSAAMSAVLRELAHSKSKAQIRY